MPAYMAHKFVFTQGGSTTVWLLSSEPNPKRGWWTSERPGYDFLDTSDGNQWILSGGFVLAYNAIGSRYETGKKPIDATNVENQAFQLLGVNYPGFSEPSSGKGILIFKYCKPLQGKFFDWEYKGTELKEFPRSVDRKKSTTLTKD